MIAENRFSHHSELAIPEYRSPRRHILFDFAAVLTALLLATLVTAQAGSAYSDTDQPDGVADVEWGSAPSWPFRGVVAHYGDEAQYMPWLEYRDTDELGLQFLDTERNQVSYVLLDHYLDSDELICAWVQSSYDANGITWVWREGLVSRGRRSWYVPWGDFAYPLFSDDVADVIDSEADSEYDPDYSSNTVSIGADGRTLTGWRIIHDEPACGGDIVFATHAVTGEVVACGWSWSSALFVDPAVTDAAAGSDHVSVSPDRPSYEACGLLDLRQWQRALAGQDGA